MSEAPRLAVLVPHSQNDENTVLDLLQELHALLHREGLATLLQVQRQGEQQRSGAAAEDAARPQTPWQQQL